MDCRYWFGWRRGGGGRGLVGGFWGELVGEGGVGMGSIWWEWGGWG